MTTDETDQPVVAKARRYEPRPGPTFTAPDPYAVDPARLKDIPVLGTVYEGRWFPSAR
jgi:hypothetical protein